VVISFAAADVLLPAKPSVKEKPESWRSFLQEVERIAEKTTEKNLTEMRDQIKDLSDDVCKTFKIPEPITASQLMIFAENASDKAMESVKQSIKFHITTILNDYVENCDLKKEPRE
jgi:hypothetical protein